MYVVQTMHDMTFKNSKTYKINYQRHACPPDHAVNDGHAGHTGHVVHANYTDSVSHSNNNYRASCMLYLFIKVIKVMQVKQVI